MASPRGLCSPAAGVPAASFTAGGPIPPRPGAAYPVAVRDRRPPGPSSGLVRGGRPRGLVRDSVLPRRASPATSFTAGGPILPHHFPPRPRAVPARGRPRRASPGAVQRPCSQRLSACLVHDGVPQPMASPCGGRPRGLVRGWRPHPPAARSGVPPWPSATGVLRGCPVASFATAVHAVSSATAPSRG